MPSFPLAAAYHPTANASLALRPPAPQIASGPAGLIAAGQRGGARIRYSEITPRPGMPGRNFSIRTPRAARIDMTVAGLRSNPMHGLTQLFAHFGPAASSSRERIFSVHPVRLDEAGFNKWCEVFGIAVAEDERAPHRARTELQAAVLELALELLQSQYENEQHLYNICHNVFKNSLHRRTAAIDIRAAVAKALLEQESEAPIGEPMARWLALLALAKYEPTLARLDAADALDYGSASQMRRQLAIVNRTPNHVSHWMLSERALLKNLPPPNAPLGQIQYIALQFACAQERPYLRPALSNSGGDLDPAIIDYAVEDLRRSLRAAGMAGRLLPPGVDGLEALPADWVERIDWMAFNGVHFLSECGARTPYRNTFTWWMLAIRDCFQPAAGLALAQMDGETRNRFVARVCDSQAFGVNRADAWDPGFVQNLFDAFLLHHVAPLAAAPFERALYRATAPLHFLGCNDPDVAPGLPQVLQSIAEVKQGLRRELFADGAPGVRDTDRALSKAQQEWIVQCLCAMYAPALTLEQMPGETAYGSIGHMTVELALLYPGVPPQNLTVEAAQQLLASESFGAAAALAAPDGVVPVREASPILTVIKRLAHAHGVIDARVEPLSPSAWNQTLQFFESRAQPPVKLDAALKASKSSIVNRAQTVTNILTEMGYDPAQKFVMPSPPLPYINPFIHAPLDYGKPHTLHKIVMEEAVQQMLAYGDLNDSQTLVLQKIRAHWPKKTLLQRCRKDFDKSLAGLIASEILPALRRFVQELPAEQQRLWQCGSWTMEIPRVVAQVKKAHLSIIDRRFKPTENIIADGAVLIDLKSGGQTLHYWVSLQPLNLAHYTCSKEELIKNKLRAFFSDNPPNAPGRKIVAFESILNYYAVEGNAGQDVLTAIVGQIFSEKTIDGLYRMSLGETSSEKTESAVYGFVRGLLPGYACAEAVASPEHLQSAPAMCALDAAAVVPILKIGAKAALQIAGVAQRAFLREFAAAAAGRMAGPAMVSRLALRAGDMVEIARKSSRQTLGYLEPGFTGVAGLWRLGKAGLVTLHRQISHIADLGDWSARIRRILRLMDDVFPDRGLWRAKRRSIQTDEGGNRHLHIEGTRYEVVDLGDVEDVLVIPDGPVKVIPINPETGLPCGFSQRRSGLLRINRAPGESAPPARRRLCRAKRGLGEAPSVCIALPQAPHMGNDYYSFPDLDSYSIYQALPLEGGRLLEIDPASAVYRSYAVDGMTLRPKDIFYRDGVLYRRTNDGQLSIIDWGLELDDVFFGSFSYENVLTKEAFRQKAWYVRAKVDLDRTRQGDGRISMIGMAPYGDFIDTDGSRMCMALLFDEPYVFKKQGAPRTNKKFKLRRASPEQIAIYESYAKINSYDYPPQIKSSIRRLYDEPAYLEIVDTALGRLEGMLESAKQYYRSADSNRFLRRFALGEDMQLADRLRQRLLGQLDAISKMMPHIRKHQDHLIAVADLYARTDSYAVSLRESLIFPLDSALLNKPLVILDWKKLKEGPLEAYLAHEFFHAVGGALDTMRLDSPLEFYAKLTKGDVDLSQLFIGAQVPGFDPGVCASVLENCFMIGHLMNVGDPRPQDVVNGRSSNYNRDDEFDVRQKRAGVKPNEKHSDMGQLNGQLSSQLSDLGLISYSLLLASLPGWYESLKKKDLTQAPPDIPDMPDIPHMPESGNIESGRMRRTPGRHPAAMAGRMRRPGKKVVPKPPVLSKQPEEAPAPVAVQPAANVTNAGDIVNAANAANAADTPMPLPAQTGPYSSAGLLQEDWADQLSLNAFDEIAFFRQFDIAVEQPASFMQRLEAAWRCFKPAMTDPQAPLDLEDMNQPRLQSFFEQLLPAAGLGHMPIERLAPRFKQHLFQRWFLTLASPPSADGNGGPYAFPLQDLLLGLSHNKPALSRGCSGQPDRPMLMRVDYLRDNIAAQFRREHPDLDHAASDWIMAALLSIFEPTLLRTDLPPNFRYGSLEWTLLDMGLRMAGPPGRSRGHRELIGLAAATEIAGADGEPGLAARFAGSMLRMAHANGAIDLGDAQADMATMLETAIAWFQRETEAMRQTASIDALLEGLPTRGSVAAAELRKRGLDPEKKYWLKKNHGYGRDLLDAQNKPLPGFAFDAQHRLIDFVMADCIWQLYEFGGLAALQSRALEQSLRGITHAGLNALFAAQFDAAFHAFADGALARRLEDQFGALSLSDARFVQCGRPEVALPTAGIVAHIPPKPDRGATGVGRKITTSVERYTADRGMLLSLTLDTGAFSTETRHYWMTQAPLAVGRFDGDVKALLQDRLDDFFTPKNAGESLWKLSPEPGIEVETEVPAGRQAEPGDASLTVAQFAARQLLAPHLPKLRERAFQMSGPETQQAEIKRAMLDMLPFWACARTLEEGSHYEAALYCLFDFIALLSVGLAGAKAAGNLGKIAAEQSRAQIARLARSLATGVERDFAHAVVRDILYVGKPLLRTGKEVARFFNPLDPLWAGFSWIRRYQGPLAAALLRKLKKTGMFPELAQDIERQMTLPCIRENGLWRAAPDAPVTHRNGLRQLQIEGRNFLLSEIGAQRDVVTLSEGGRLYLADPRDGGLLAPVMAPGAEPWRNPGRSLSDLRSCRSRRSGETAAACGAEIGPAPQFGVRYRRVVTEKKFEGVQMSVREMARGRKLYLRTDVDLNDLGFLSYTKTGPSGLAQSRPFNRYFAFEGKVWIAEDGHLRKTGIVCEFPDSIKAKVVRLNLPGILYGGADYLRLEIALPPIPGDDRHYFQTFIAPYGTYAGRGGKCMGMVDFPIESYMFEHSWINELQPGAVVTLKRVRAGEPDPLLFEQYRRINTYVRQQPDMFIAHSLYPLRDASPIMQHRFDIICSGSDSMLAAALYALRNPTPVLKKLMRKLLPASWTSREKRRFLDTIESNVERMIEASGIVRRNKYDVIGFGTAKRSLHGAGAQMSLTFARAEALSGALVGRMDDFPLIKHAAIYFDTKHFMGDDKETLEMDSVHEETLKTDYVHELSHACLKTFDTISAKSTLPVYSRQLLVNRNDIDIGDLRSAWAEPGSDPAMHAATNEIVIKLLSMAVDPAQRRGLAGLMKGGSIFPLTPDGGEAG